jgi:magnesium-transporting ATPase (P-type)
VELRNGLGINSPPPEISAMHIRILIFIISIFVLIFIYISHFTFYGGKPFISYGEAISYFANHVWFNLTNGSLLTLPIRIISLPFLSAQDCLRPGCEWMGFLFIVIYYTFWFYGITPFIMKIYHKITKTRQFKYLKSTRKIH